jgi:osmotically inducible lipoprotein OsmB
MHIITVFAVLAGLSLAACGDTTGERAASGGLIGGAAGLAVGAPVAGAAVESVLQIELEAPSTGGASIWNNSLASAL